MKVYGELVRAQLEILQADPSAGIEGRIWFNDVTDLMKIDLDGTNIAHLFNSQQTLVPSISTIDLGNTGAPFQALYLSSAADIDGTLNVKENVGLGGGNNSGAIVAVGVVQTATLSADTQSSIYVRITASTASTAGVYGINCNPTTVAGSWTTDYRVHFGVGNLTKGASSTITRDIGLGGNFPTQGTYNAFISDNVLFTANYFINSTSTSGSLLSGPLTLAELTASTVVYTDANKKLTSSAVTPTELGYLSGATSSLQTQISAINAAALSNGLLANVAIATAVTTSSDLIISMVGANGSAISSTNDASINFRSTTATSGQFVQRALAAAGPTLTVPSGATLAQFSGIPNRLFVYAIDNAGTIELAVASREFYDEDGIVTTTAISATASDASLIYSTTARAGVASRLIGTIKNTQTVAGTWASAGTTLTPNQMDIAQCMDFERGSGVLTFPNNAGVGASNMPTMNYHWQKIGNFVQFSIINSCTFDCSSTDSFYATATAAVPATIRPQRTIQCPLIMAVNGVISSTMGRVDILSTGVVKLFRVADAGSNWTAGTTNNGPSATAFMYGILQA